MKVSIFRRPRLLQIEDKTALKMRLENANTKTKRWLTKHAT